MIHRFKQNLCKVKIHTFQAYYQRSCHEVQSRSTLSDKIVTEKEKFRLGCSENPDFFRLKIRGLELIQILLPSTLPLMTASLVLGPYERIL